MRASTFSLDTKSEEMRPITSIVQQVVENAGVTNGLCVVYCPHTTAGITINENADPDVRQDLLIALQEAFPGHTAFCHVEGNSAAHAKASAVGAFAMVPIQDGRLLLGRWQGIFFCEFDGPRHRQFHVQVMGEESIVP